MPRWGEVSRCYRDAQDHVLFVDNVNSFRTHTLTKPNGWKRKCASEKWVLRVCDLNFG